MQETILSLTTYSITTTSAVTSNKIIGILDHNKGHFQWNILLRLKKKKKSSTALSSQTVGCVELWLLRWNSAVTLNLWCLNKGCEVFSSGYLFTDFMQLAYSWFTCHWQVLVFEGRKVWREKSRNKNPTPTRTDTHKVNRPWGKQWLISVTFICHFSTRLCHWGIIGCLFTLLHCQFTPSWEVLRKCSDLTAAEDASHLSECSCFEFEDVGTEREKEKCCFSLSSGCYLSREECCGSSGSSPATIVQASAAAHAFRHGRLFFLFFPTPHLRDSGHDGGWQVWWETQAKDKKMAGVS